MLWDFSTLAMCVRVGGARLARRGDQPALLLLRLGQRGERAGAGGETGDECADEARAHSVFHDGRLLLRAPLPSGAPLPRGVV